ncbi:hypothetical protein BD413DRAFT_86370 [Trametes elegans]|nr:hypothetical protein BD413DRAFT_86370 [Trametes elegans]
MRTHPLDVEHQEHMGPILGHGAGPFTAKDGLYFGGPLVQPTEVRLMDKRRCCTFDHTLRLTRSVTAIVNISGSVGARPDVLCSAQRRSTSAPLLSERVIPSTICAECPDARDSTGLWTVPVPRRSLAHPSPTRALNVPNQGCPRHCVLVATKAPPYKRTDRSI